MKIFHKTYNVYIRNGFLLVTAAWLITISFIIDNYWSGDSSIKSIQRSIQEDLHEQQDEFSRISSDTALINKLATRNYDEAFLKRFMNNKMYLFVNRIDPFLEEFPLFWSTQVIQPDANTTLLGEGTHFAKLVNGWYLIQIKLIPKPENNQLKVIGLVPVKWDYYTDYPYLENTFLAMENIEDIVDINRLAGQAAVKAKNGEVLFYLQDKNQENVQTNNIYAVWLRIIATLFVLLYLHVIATYLVAKRGVLIGSLFLLLSVFLLRLLSYSLPIPLNFRQFELFDPAVYGSNFILRSLGDLFINSLLFTWIILFLRHHLYGKRLIIRTTTRVQKYVLLVFLSLAIVVTTLTIGHIVRSLVADSQISFDVVNFFSLTLYSVIGFIVFSFLVAGYFFLMQMLIYLAGQLVKDEPYLLYIALAVTGLLVVSIRSGSSYVSFELLLLLWMLAFILLIRYNFLSMLGPDIVSSRFIFWIFFFSLSITIVIVSKNKEKELDSRKHFAEKLAIRADPSSDRLMNIVLSDFRNSFLSENFNRLRNPFQNKFLKDSIINKVFSAYLNQYDTRIYTFDQDGKALHNSEGTSFNTLNAIVETQGKPTDFPGLYYYDVSYDKFNYISKKTITGKDTSVLGHVFILASPKRFKTDALYPELFAKSNTNAIETSPIYAYAIYTKNNLTISHNDYPFPTQLRNIKLTNNEYSSRSVNGYDELWFNAGNDKLVVIAKQESFLIESITLFAYIFCSFLIITAVFWLLNLFIRGRFNPRRVKHLWQLSIRNQVHGTIIFISVLSFLIIGVATILFFINRYHNNNRERLSRTIHVMENQVRNSLEELSVFDDEVKVYDLVSKDTLQKLIHTVSDIHAVDINLYDLDGNLKVSSLPLPYEKGFVSTKMDPIAFYHLNHLKEVQFFQEQMIGQLSYLSNYVPVRDAEGKEYAYLNIPYFESQSKLKEEIASFLVTIINLNAFIFLLAGIVALFITNRITKSFSLISSKMKEINLGQVNEEISWSRKDEIGDLVNEYNKMVKKLDASAEMLARSEREGAWREMARQVAHEIKNPLTPMKLNLQYLQMAIDTNAPGVKQISINMAKTLLQQIEHLSKIASDFSQFANIGQSNNEIFNLVTVLQHVVSLFSGGENVNIATIFEDDKLSIDADRTQINRLFTNLLQNAIQAIPEDRQPQIIIKATREDDMAVVSIQDNGTGIPAMMRSKIFTPNFTTKSSGTGLGLAMCKGIVEQTHGNIWFETSESRGTIFYVELPLARQEIKQTDEEQSEV